MLDRSRPALPFRRCVLVALTLVLMTVVPPAAHAQGCPERVDESAFASAADLAAWNGVMTDLGARPTGSPNQDRFIAWIEERLDEIGLARSSLEDRIDRWLETGTSLRLDEPGKDAAAVPVAAAVPYSRASAAKGELLYLPPSTPIADADVTGKIVVRDVVPGVIPLPVFFAVAYYVHDPGLTFDYTGNYERDWISAAQRVTDLQQAAEAGAAGLVFAHELPLAQVEGDYVPYTGDFWGVPAVYVGVDEAELLKAASEGSRAKLRVEAEQTADVPIRSVIATLPGDPGQAGDERIVISSHTDGMNAVWDNGPIGILALARYFASLPLECRPRTIEFVFTTAHLYLSHAGAEKYAGVLDEAYDQGTVAFAVVLEHLGAREFVAAPRPEPLPGRQLESTGLSELSAVFVHESVATLEAVTRSVVERDLRRSFILRGADAPAVAFPPHRSYGGEGGPYHGHLIPTVAAITGPATLFKPAFTQEELLDVELMRRQTLAFGDVILQLQGLPREVIAGADTLYRVGRDATE